MKKLAFIAAALALAAGPAHAGPVAAAIAVIKATAVGAALLKIAVGIGLSLVSSAILTKLAGKPKVDVKFDVDMGDDKPLSFTVGKYATAGKRKFIGSWGPSTMYITEVIEVSCLPQALAAMWVNDEPANIKWGTTESHTSKYVIGYNEVERERGGFLKRPIYGFKSFALGHPVTNLSDDGNRIWIRYYDGTQTEADDLLVGVFGASSDYPWTDDFIGTGKSYVVVTTRYDSDTLTQYPTYLWEPAPLPLYDPRKDATVGGEGDHVWGDLSTYEPTTNPAVIAYNIARGIHYGDEWIYGGKNLAAWRLPWAEWVAAMNACDAEVELEDESTEPAYRCGAEIAVDMEPAGVLEELGRAANMRIAEVGGRLKPLVDLPGAAVFSFTDDDILITEGQSFSPFYPVADTYNAAQATYPEPAEKWSSKDAPEYIDADAMAADGDRYLPVSLSYSACPFGNQVQRLMRAQLQDYRRMRRHQISLPPDAYGIEPGDMVSWSSARNGYANKKFIVEQVQKQIGFNVAVSLREVDPGDYDWSTEYQLPIVIVPPKAPVKWVQDVPGFYATATVIADSSATSRRPAIAVGCDGDVAGATQIRIQVRLAGEVDPVINIVRPYVEPFEWLLTDVLPNEDYEVQGQIISTLSNGSLWSEWIAVTTLDVRLGPLDIAQTVYDQMAEIALEAGITPVDDLPDAGLPNQIVMLKDTGQLYRWDDDAEEWTTALYSGIAPGSVDITKLASTLEVPLTHTGAIPASRQSSDLIYRTNDGKLYRWNGTAYVATVAAADISGQLAAAQIAALEASKITGQLSNSQLAEIAAAKLTGQITSTQITDSAITTAKVAAGAIETAKLAAGAVVADKIAANAVTTAKIEAGAVSTAKLAAGAVDADKIAANAVTAAKIQAGAVTAGKIAADAVEAGTIAAGAIGAREVAADAITASKLAVADMTNLNAGHRYNDLGWWSWTSGATFTTQTLGGAWENALGVNLTSPAGGTNAFAWGKPFPVSPGDQLYGWGEYGVVSPDGATTAGVRIQYSATEDFASVMTSTLFSATSSPRTTGEGSSTVPAGMFFARVNYMKNGGTTSVTARFGKVLIRRKNAGNLIVDGAITTNKIESGAITTDTLAAGAVVASKIAAGAVTAIKIDALAVTADKIAANAVTTAKIEAGAVTAGKISVSSLSAIAADVGTLTAGVLRSSNFSTGVSGAEFNLTTGALEVNSIFVREPNLAANAAVAGDGFYDENAVVCGSSWTTVAEVVIASTTGKVFLNYEFTATSATANGSYRLTRNGTEIFGPAPLSLGGSTKEVVRSWLDKSPVSGAATYRVQIQASGGGSITATARQLIAFQFKKT